MQKNLVIVESPAKAKTIEKFLGSGYKVMSSYGHIRDLKRQGMGIDSTTLLPDYEVPKDKQKLVDELKAQAKKTSQIWLASDEDREGEAISWHLCQVLGLDVDTTKRIVFHEITKSAIINAIDNPRTIDMNLVNAQQARRVLDRLVGFMVSPVLWRKVKPALSAGRVQSVAVRLIVDREREVQAFKSEPYYHVSALFAVGKQMVKATLATRFRTKAEAQAFLEQCLTAQFAVTQVQKKPMRRTPAPPFTTSTLQQEAARKLGFTVSQTMMVAQHLYESGKITYMRTDSVNLSALCINATKEAVGTLYGTKYGKVRQYHTSSKGAQEAHEAIRPTHMEDERIEGTPQERRLYELIWKRTVASQMADAEIEKTTVTIGMTTAQGEGPAFVATGEVVTFDGFLKVYHESAGDDETVAEDNSRRLPKMSEGTALTATEITADERTSTGPQRYTEASLVHKLEELGIGRPSTYAPTISTIQQREYVAKGDKKGEEQPFCLLTLKDGKLTESTHTEAVGADKGKLLPTDIGMVVNDFLMDHFTGIMDYNFTAQVEQDFDLIAEGKEDWNKMMQDFYKDFKPTVDETLSMREDHRVGERQIGVEPATGKPVFVKIGRFGPMVQIGNADDSEKPRFAHLPKEKSMDSLTLEEALDLFKLPRTLGEYEGKTVVVSSGRFGPYVKHDGKYVSLPKKSDPMATTLEEAIELINDKREQEKKKHLKAFDEDPDMEVLNGRYGPYIAYKGKNYRLPKALHEKAAQLTHEECMAIVEKN